MKTVEAIYERGVLRPLEPLTFPEGTRVRVSLPAEPEATPMPAPNGLDPEEDSGENDAAGPTEEQRRRFVEAIAAIAALPVEGKTDPFSGRDHDRVLYGENGAA